MKFSRWRIILILTLLSILIGLLVYSFAFTTEVQSGVTTNYLTISDISFGLLDATESINLGDQLPTIDKFGIENESFDFSIANTSKKEQGYIVRLTDVNISTIANNNVRYQLTIDGVSQSIKELSLNGIIDSGVIKKGEKIDYSLKIWLSYDADVTNGTWDKVVKVEAGTINVDDSGANEPILTDNMIPVYYDETREVWKKADQKNANINHYWYDYNEQMWANAVTVTEESRSYLLEAPLGTEIPLDDINSMWVWVPRFKYNLFANDKIELIDITFEKGVESTGTMSCVIVDGQEKCEGEGSYNHPAFKFGDETISGFWVSKFELGVAENTICYTDTANCSIDDLVILIKPNQKSLQDINLTDLFQSVRKMEVDGNIYGFANSGKSLNNDGLINDDDNQIDLHLTKTFESAALTYLTYSKYGKLGNENYESDYKNVFVNPKNNKTGASSFNKKVYDYNVNYYGTGASTTGNVYGVYDLNGGVSEYLMANVLDVDGKFLSANSGFSEILDSRYYDVYPYADLSANSHSFYGDGIKEFKGFSADASQPANAAYPFIFRTSITSVTFAKGEKKDNVGGRAVLIVPHDAYITRW